MQFSVFSTSFLVAILAGTAFAAPSNLKERSSTNPCGKGRDCCYSSKPACERQVGSLAYYLTCFDPDVVTYCSDEGITMAQCDADCCSIKTTFGRSCS
ncbi:hypothetical protein HBI55_078000 [Parastagonospora nodorum]|nr:hypothetical protein HBI10_112420 [Parastagonospora nodorum]KAH4014643.1 hypothetical protein HBI13_168750 [Parastagonospora nodorum]KAH4035066.1 hypothetical protein HBI09_094840 [Parastagonospora nodorum]KAH4115890.1 hypothetical protein HBH47_174000 [Parastagonospora nodorum]KAH4172375.1 hypothetical protein HBH43_089130 [Parastagonospora nodorum]